MADPFRIAVLGDSIMWGQGLAEDEKFSTQVKLWLGAELRRPIELQVIAHSRAVIAADQVRDLVPARPGEIPHQYPSITAQAKKVVDPALVDLVLVNGGINDMGAEQIVSPLHVLELDWIRHQATVHCGRMKELLLSTLLPRFPKAVILVIGYYPPISAQSDPLLVSGLVSLLCSDLAPLSDIIKRVETALLVPLANQSAAWAEASNDALEDAVRSAQLRRTDTDTAQPDRLSESSPTTRAQPSRISQGIAFVPIPFAPEHCYAAPKSLLWTLGERDSVMNLRIKQCLEFAVGNPTCPVEAAFHPNRAGALHYFEAIKSELRRFMSAWKELSG